MKGFLRSFMRVFCFVSAVLFWVCFFTMVLPVSGAMGFVASVGMYMTMFASPFISLVLTPVLLILLVSYIGGDLRNKRKDEKE